MRSDKLGLKSHFGVLDTTFLVWIEPRPFLTEINEVAFFATRHINSLDHLKQRTSVVFHTCSKVLHLGVTAGGS